MCNYDILHHNEHGYIVKCRGCENLKVAFGTTTLTLNEDDFYELKYIADACYDRYKNCSCRSQKQIQIPTTTQAITLVYTLEELEKLIQLMDEAYINMEVQRLLAN